ncbi:MAG TPA: ABC transporter permease [Bryobacteraceae bacterium]
MFFQTLLADARYALRQLRLSPVFTLAAALTLALGIGGTTAVFSLIHAILLRSLPVVDPASLYRIGAGDECCVEGGLQENWSLFSYDLYKRFQQITPEFEQLAAFQANPWQMSVRRGNEPASHPMHAEFITGNYFGMFGIRAFAGRALTPGDDQPSAAPAAMLSYRAWQQSFGSAPSIIGSTFIIEGHPFTIVGISPPGFYGDTLRSDPPELWVPLQQEPLMKGTSSLLRHPSTSWLRVIGRLKPGDTTGGMSERLTAYLRHWLPAESGYPAEVMPLIKQALPKQHVQVIRAGSGVEAMQENYGGSLKILLTACALVLLIACANVANLLLARGMARRSNASLRLALGASRRQLMRQFLIESIVLGLVGGAAGIAVAYAGARLMLLLAFGSAHFVPIDVSPSPSVLMFALGLSLLTGILFGTAPAWFAANSDPIEALRGFNRSTGDSSTFSQKALLIAQAALSVMLVAGAALLMRSLANVEHQNFGFETKNRLSVQLNSPLASYSPEKLDSLYTALEAKLAAIPGVERASLALYTPFTDNWGDGIVVEGKPMPPVDADTNSSWDRVTPDYFEAVGQPLVRGRGFTRQDSGNSRPVAVVNQAFVRKFFKDQNPIGKHFGLDLPETASTFEIIGVVRDGKYVDAYKPARAMFFVPLLQHVPFKNPLLMQGEIRSHFIGSALLLTGSDRGSLEPQIRRAFSAVDPNLTITGIHPLAEQIAGNFEQERAVAQLTGLFGLIALLLAAVGIYGVTAYTVARRTSEIGVRMALGADRFSVTRLVLRGAFMQIAIGLAIGIPAAIGASRLLAAQLYNVRSWDPAALSTAILSLGICALLATVLPARRAASIDPMTALRTE